MQRCTLIRSPQSEVDATVWVTNSGKQLIDITHVDQIKAGDDKTWWSRTKDDKCSGHKLAPGEQCAYTVTGYINYSGTPGANLGIRSGGGGATFGFMLYDPHSHAEVPVPSAECTTR